MPVPILLYIQELNAPHVCDGTRGLGTPISCGVEAYARERRPMYHVDR